MKRSAVTQEERYQQMVNDPVEQLIPRLALPSIVSMLVTAVYNTADTFFVSQISTAASGAVGINFSLMSILQAFAFTIGMGSANMISRLLGKRDMRAAERYAATGYFTELLFGTFLAAVCMLNLRRLVYLLGSTDTIAPYAMDYARYILFGAPFLMCSLGMNNMLRFQGNSFYSMIGIASGGILNMILDPILIFGFRMGIAGAAIATAFSQFVSFVILTCQCNFMPACITIRFRNFRPTLEMYKNIIHIGLPSLARQGIMSIGAIVLNKTAHPYGDAAISAMAIVTRFSMLMNSSIIGFGQGFQPVCGFNYGARNYRRVRRAYFFSLKTCTMILVVFGVFTFLFARPIVTLFRREDAEVIRIGTLALRLQALTFPLQAQIVFANMFTQTVGYGFRAAFVATLKSGTCLIPILLVLPRFLGLFGIQAAQPLSDIISAFIAFLIVRGLLAELSEKEAYQERVERGEEI